MKQDLKKLMRSQYLQYASYVILDRAIPQAVDGLKPVQRRILHTLFKLSDGKLHKVANVAGQTMAYHPHGDAPITDALTNMAMKGYLFDMQGNFGNLLTGDPAAASRYIETRLSELALETLFNPDLTEMASSYDGRNKEPVSLPAKIPLVLLQGANGIAVGMATNILPHNFTELLEAQIAILDKKKFNLFPDFPNGGIMDPSEYSCGKGKVKVRAKIEIKDPKTLLITEICPGTTTESVTRSIDEAAKRGKIKIESINDYTAEKAEIEVNLPRGQYAKDLIDPLYAFTDCEVSINSQVVVIKDDLPWDTTIDEVLHYNTSCLQDYLKRELEIERDRLKEKIFEKTLERIFIENRLYKKIEDIPSYDLIHETIEKSLKPFHQKLSRIPTYEDRERLLNIPIRRISRFDLDKNRDDIKAFEERLTEVEKDLKQIKKVTIRYLKHLIKKYGKLFPRRTKIKKFESVDIRAVATKQIKVGYDPEKGVFGTKVSGPWSFECTNFDKILVLFNDGTYKVVNPVEKEYLHHEGKQAIHIGLADKKTVMNILYCDGKTKAGYAKRFAVTKFILDKEYRFFGEGDELLYFGMGEKVDLTIKFAPKAKQKVKEMPFSFEDVLVKGVSAKGIRIANRPVKKVVGKGNNGDDQLKLF